LNQVKRRSVSFKAIVAITVSFMASCAFQDKDFDPKATLIIQVMDDESKQTLEYVNVNLRVGGDILTRKNEIYSVPTDVAGRVQFQGLPKSAFSIEVLESDRFKGYDTTFASGSSQVNNINNLGIYLKQKKTVFIGIIMDADDNQPLDRVQVKLSESEISTYTDSRGKFRLQISHLNQKIIHKIHVSKSSVYSSRSIDVENLKINEINDMKSITLKMTSEKGPGIVNGGKKHVPVKRPQPGAKASGSSGP